MEISTDELFEIEVEAGNVENYFINQREYRGAAITKDNCEAMFESWCENLSQDEKLRIIKEINKEVSPLEDHERTELQAIINK